MVQDICSVSFNQVFDMVCTKIFSKYIKSYESLKIFFDHENEIKTVLDYMTDIPSKINYRNEIYYLFFKSIFGKLEAETYSPISMSEWMNEFIKAKETYYKISNLRSH